MTSDYTPQTWVDGIPGGTPISAARLGIIEAGIANHGHDSSYDLPESPNFYLSQASWASDSNSGLTKKDSVSTLARALQVIGTTNPGPNTLQSNPAILNVGKGVWDFSGTSGFSARAVQGCRVRGLGPGFTQILGPDNGPALKGINTYNMMVEDLWYLGSPGGTGWGIEYTTDFRVTALLASASGGQILPQSTLVVDSTAGFSPVGNGMITTDQGVQHIFWTGTTSTTLTGVTGGIGVMTTGSTVIGFSFKGGITATQCGSRNVWFGNNLVGQGRVDAVTTDGSTTVLDTAILLGDVGKTFNSGTNNNTINTVVSVTPGVSFVAAVAIPGGTTSITLSPAFSCASGIRWSLGDGNWWNDGNNDQGFVSGAIFWGCRQALSVEHSQSVFHTFASSNRYINCGGIVVTHGGSFALEGPVFGNTASLAGAWLADIQDPMGTSSQLGQNQAIYRHPSYVLHPQSEQGQIGWARSSPGSAATIAGAYTALGLTFIGGELNPGGVGGIGSNVIDWKAAPTGTNNPSQLAFIGTRCYPRYGSPVIYSPSVTGELYFERCEMYGMTYNWAGGLRHQFCRVLGANTFTPIGGAVRTEIGCSGTGFTGGVIVDGATLGVITSNTQASDAGYAGWTDDNDRAGSAQSLNVTSGHLLLARIKLAMSGPLGSVDFYVNNAAVGAVSNQCFVAILDDAGNRLGLSADISATLGGTGIKQISLTAPTASQSAGQFVRVAMLVNVSGGGATMPLLRSVVQNSPVMNLRLVASTFRFGTAGSGLTAIPSFVDPTTIGSFSSTPWFGVA